MSSGGGDDDAGAGDGGRAEWQRIYDRVEALAAGRARLEARNRTQHEFWDARDKINHSRLHQAELSRSRWEAACRELLPSDDPKLAELLESDLEDSRTCEALLDTENLELLVQLKEDGTCVELNENTADHEHTSGDLISELRKLKRIYETLLEGKLNELNSLDKENDNQKLKVAKSKTLKRKFASLSNIQSKEAGNCVETIQENADHGAIARDLRAELRKLKQAYETLSSNKDKEISAPLAVEDFLLNKLLRIDKDNAGLLKIKEVEAAQANEAAQKLQQTVEELQVAVRYKDDEIGRLRAEAGPLKIKEVEAAQASKAVQMLQQSVEELQVAVGNKDDEIGKLGAEAASVEKMVLTLEGKLLEMQSLVKEKNDEIQKLKNGQPESLKCKCASSIPVEFVRQMPLFDEWGLRPAGLEGPRENPALVVPLPAVPAARPPEVDAGGRAPPSAAGAGAGEMMQPGASETSAPEARVSCPEGVAGEMAQSKAPEVAAPEAWVSSPEVEAGELARPDAPEVATPGAPPNDPDADALASCASRLGPLRINFEALRKMKPSGRAYRLLKPRMYIAIDE
ncbi:hypothetical protein CFC21_008661 [Triticum aestivum]|uniref:Uncharacterized protein n=2 Tax=Triticum aestivum TaxID=4565 RepID=A0A9R1ISM7_WHEAT|nr:uncharacterized protein LOC123143861 isoform X2 [Triticum aestivum]KAF6991590.1 hypothetical protein CFC21_008661 [Triticum aestivum]